MITNFIYHLRVYDVMIILHDRLLARIFYCYKKRQIDFRIKFDTHHD